MHNSSVAPSVWGRLRNTKLKSFLATCSGERKKERESVRERLDTISRLTIIAFWAPILCSQVVVSMKSGFFLASPGLRRDLQLKENKRGLLLSFTQSQIATVWKMSSAVVISILRRRPSTAFDDDCEEGDSDESISGIIPKPRWANRRVQFGESYGEKQKKRLFHQIMTSTRMKTCDLILFQANWLLWLSDTFHKKRYN